VIVLGIRGEIKRRLKDGVDSLFPLHRHDIHLILFSNLFTLLPGYVAPTSSLTTTSALGDPGLLRRADLRHQQTGSSSNT
jgi:hypothetical protein